MSATTTVTETDSQKAIDLNYSSHPAELVDGGVNLPFSMFDLIANRKLEDQFKGYGGRLA